MGTKICCNKDFKRYNSYVTREKEKSKEKIVYTKKIYNNGIIKKDVVGWIKDVCKIIYIYKSLK